MLQLHSTHQWIWFFSLSCVGIFFPCLMIFLSIVDHLTYTSTIFVSFSRCFNIIGVLLSFLKCAFGGATVEYVGQLWGRCLYRSNKYWCCSTMVLQDQHPLTLTSKVLPPHQQRYWQFYLRLNNDMITWSQVILWLILFNKVSSIFLNKRWRLITTTYMVIKMDGVRL